MATKWRSGTGTWDGSNTSIWWDDAARTIQSGTVPTSADDVIYDTSTTDTSCSTTRGVCICNNFTGTKGISNSTGNITVVGNLSVKGGVAESIFYVTGNLALTGNLSSFVYFCGNNTTSGIFCNGYKFNFIRDDNSITGKTINFLDEARGSQYITYLATVTNTNNYNIHIDSGFISSGILNAGTSTINTNITTSNATSIAAGSNCTNATLNITGRSEFTVNSPFLNLNVTGALALTETLGVCKFGNPTNCTITALRFLLNATETFNNLTIVGYADNRTIINSNIEYTRCTITVNGTLSVTGCIFRNIATDASSKWNLSQASDVGDGGYNSGIIFPPPRNLTWTGVTGGTFNDYASWQHRVLLFDGTNDYIRLSNKITRFDDARNPWTVQFTMITQPIDTATRVIIGNTYGMIRGFRIITATNQLHIYLRNTATTNDLRVIINNLPTNGTVVTVTYDGSMLSSGVNVYYNGVNQTKSQITDKLTSYDLSSPYVLSTTISGAWSASSTVSANYLGNSISGVSVWSSVVAPNSGTLPDLLDLRLENSVGTTVRDYSPSGNNGTMYNFTQPNCWITSTNTTPLPQDVSFFDVNSITSTTRVIEINHYSFFGDIQCNGLLNSPTFKTTALHVIFLGNIDVSGFGVLNSNKYWYHYHNRDVLIRGNSSLTVFSLNNKPDTERLVTFDGNINISSWYTRYNFKIKNNSNVTVTNHYNQYLASNIDIDSGSKLVITSGANYGVVLTQTGLGSLELAGTTPNINNQNNYVSNYDFSFTNLVINASGTASLTRTVAATSRVATYNIGKLTFLQPNKSLNFYGEGGANGSVRLVVGEVVVADGNTLEASNGQGRLSISDDSKNKSKVLDFASSTLINIAVISQLNSVYCIGTRTNCSGIEPRKPILVGYNFTGGIIRSRISKINNTNSFI